jgi:hypothetical protein
MAGARAVHLAEPHARIDQDQLPAGIHNERILVDREIALVEGPFNSEVQREGF